MEFIYNIISTWGGAINAVYSQHTIVAAIFTIAAIYLFIELQKLKPNQTLINVLIILVAWLIIVPIIGWVLNAISFIWDLLKQLLNFLIKIYSLFEKQPVLFLIYFVISVVFYFYWRRKTTSNYLKIIVPILIFIILLFVTAPIANQLGDKNSSTTVTNLKKSG